MKKVFLKAFCFVTVVLLMSSLLLTSCARDVIDGDDTWRDKWNKLIVKCEKEPEFVAARYSPGTLYESQTYGITDPERPGAAREDHTIVGEIRLDEADIKILLKELKKVNLDSFYVNDPEFFTEEAQVEFQDMPYLDIRIVVDSTLVKQASGDQEGNEYNNDTNSGYKYALRIFIYEDGHVYIRDYLADLKFISTETVDFNKLKALVTS